jgi:hypothetical protein
MSFLLYFIYSKWKRGKGKNNQDILHKLRFCGNKLEIHA